MKRDSVQASKFASQRAHLEEGGCTSPRSRQIELRFAPGEYLLSVLLSGLANRWASRGKILGIHDRSQGNLCVER
jgi:hypothetical protein